MYRFKTQNIQLLELLKQYQLMTLSQLWFYYKHMMGSGIMLMRILIELVQTTLSHTNKKRRVNSPFLILICSYSCGGVGVDGVDGVDKEVYIGFVLILAISADVTLLLGAILSEGVFNAIATSELGLVVI